MAGDRTEPNRIRTEDDTHLDAPVGEMTSRHQAASSVAPRPRQYHHAGRREPKEPEPAEAPPGVLHHLFQFDMEVFDHDPVDLPHLIHGHGGDRCAVGNREERIGHQVNLLASVKRSGAR